jgi:hypothetical protein
LKKAKDGISELLSMQFNDECPYRRLPGGKVLERVITTVQDALITPDMKVGDVIRKGYSYPEYKEIEG